MGGYRVYSFISVGVEEIGLALLYEKLDVLLRSRPIWSRKDFRYALNHNFQLGKLDCKGLISELKANGKIVTDKRSITVTSKKV